MSVQITSAFDAGNIDVINASDPSDIRLVIRKDNESDFYQWYYFRVTGAKGVPLTLKLTNAGGAAYTGGWTDYKSVASYDRDDWFRIPTTRYENGELIIEVTPEQDSLYLAYFAPYSQERHADLIADALQHDGISLRVLGQTLDGRDLDCLSLGTGDKNIWITARQHPGESMAEWWVEGFLARLLDPEDEAAQALLSKSRLHIVPNMNPDGSFRGHLRTNAVGANLNREWDTPTMERAPEVLLTRNAMDQDPPVLAFDVHGDEALPYNFIAGAEGIPNYSQKQIDDKEAFLAAYLEASPDFQTEHGYPISAPGTANLSMCTNQLAHRFDCLAMTLEMPFKDNANNPDADEGWSPDRAAQFGADTIDAFLSVIDRL